MLLQSIFIDYKIKVSGARADNHGIGVSDTFWAGTGPWQWRTQDRPLTNHLLCLFAQGEPCWRLQLGEQGIQEEQTKDKWHQKRLPQTSKIQKAGQQSAVSMTNVSEFHREEQLWEQSAGKSQGMGWGGVGVRSWALELDVPDIKSPLCHSLTPWARLGHVVSLSVCFLICQTGIRPIPQVVVSV